jgi:simple sugar transport system permease protein
VAPAEVLTVAAPLLWAAVAELLGQRSGVLNIGIEGLMLIGCLSAALAAPVVGPWPAVLVAAGVTLLANLLLGLVIVAGADQVVAGTGVVLAGMGLTGAIFRHVQARGFSGALLPTLPWGPLELGALMAAGVLAWVLASTRAGLVVRACGESPEAVAAAGISPVRVRLAVLAVAGALVGVAGATLVLRASGSFVEGMTAGRGFLALALVMLGRWRPWLVAAGTLLLGAAIALQFHLQGLGLAGVPYHLLLALPYLLTLVVLAVVPPDRLGGPAALARPYRAQR